jgi:hypothetical protein
MSELQVFRYHKKEFQLTRKQCTLIMCKIAKEVCHAQYNHFT